VVYLEPLASRVADLSRRTGSCAPREGINGNRGVPPSYFSMRCVAFRETSLDFEAGVSPQTANLAMILFSSGVSVTDNRNSLLRKRGSWV
jgi:hypothetical protein